MKKLFRNPKAKAATGFLLLGQKANNIQRLLFFALILGIPTQFGRHFWPDFSFVSGVRVDYLSPTLYVTDILIFLIFALEIIKFSIFSFKFSIKSQFSTSQKDLVELADFLKSELIILVKELTEVGKEIREDVSQISSKHKVQLTETLKRSKDHTLEVWNKVTTKQ